MAPTAQQTRHCPNCESSLSPRDVACLTCGAQLVCAYCEQELPAAEVREQANARRVYCSASCCEAGL